MTYSILSKRLDILKANNNNIYPRERTTMYYYHNIIYTLSKR